MDHSRKFPTFSTSKTMFMILDDYYLLSRIGDVIISQDRAIWAILQRDSLHFFKAPRFKQTKTQKQHSLLTVNKNTIYPLANKHRP